MKFAVAFLSALTVVNGIELTPDNWDAETAGKTVLVKVRRTDAQKLVVELPRLQQHSHFAFLVLCSLVWTLQKDEA